MESYPLARSVPHYGRGISWVQNLVTRTNNSYLLVTEVNDRNIYYLTNETL